MSSLTTLEQFWPGFAVHLALEAILLPSFEILRPTNIAQPEHVRSLGVF